MSDEAKPCQPANESHKPPLRPPAGACEFMTQYISKTTGKAEICLKHGRERVFCENESLRKELAETKGILERRTRKLGDEVLLRQKAEQECVKKNLALVELKSRLQRPMDSDRIEELKSIVNDALTDGDVVEAISNV